MPRTLGGFVYEADGGATTYIVDAGGFGITVGSGNALVLNADAASGVNYFEIHSSSLTDNFKLVSLMIESFGGSSSVAFTVTGYDGGSSGTLVASQTINLTSSSGAYGSITYAKTPSADGGTLTFDSTWQNVDTIRFTRSDGTGIYCSIDNIDISPAVSTTAPTLTATGTNLTFTENGSAVDLYSSVTADTNDSGQTFSGMTMTVTNVSNGASEVLNIASTNVALNDGNSGSLAGGVGSYSVSVAASTATVTLSGMTRDNTLMGTLVDGMTYSNSSDNPGSTSRVVTITSITDSGSSNNTASPNRVSTVSVTPVNDNPSLTGLPASLNFTEDISEALALNLDVNDFVDPDSTNITVVFAASSGTLGLANPGGSLTQADGNGTGTVTLAGTLANVNTYLNTPSNVTYYPTNVSGTFSLTVTANDGNGSGNVALGTVTLNVAGVNDAPTASNMTQSKSATEGGSAVALDDIVITEIDSGDTVTATFTLSNTAAGSLSTGTYGAATSTFNAGTGIWTVTGSVSDVNAALAAVALTPSADNEQNFTITTRIRDAANTGPADGTITVTVMAVNDAPSLVSGTVPLTGTNENSTSPSTLVSTILASSTVSDVDTGAAFGIAITATSGNGTWQYSTNGAAWTAFGTVSDSSALLLNSTSRIRFVGDGMNGGTATFTWRAWDRTSGTSSANGAPSKADTSSNGGSTAFSTNTSTASLNVTSVNDAPTVANAIPDQNAAEDAAFNFPFAANTFADVDTGATLTYSTQLAGGGSLPSWLNFDAATRTFSGTPADSDVGTISIDVTADDGNGGTVTDTFNIVVANTNDAPTFLALSPLSVNQSSGTNATIGTFTTTDADVGDTFTYTLVSGGGDTHNASFNISGSTLRANNAAALAGGVYSVRVRTTDSGNAHFESSFSITVVDDVAPSAPTGFSATPSGSTVALSWTNPSSDFDSVTIRRSASSFPASTASGTGVTSGSTSTSLTDTGLADGTYYYAIFTRDPAGNFSAAATASATVDTIAPAAPVFTTITHDTGTSATDQITSDTTLVFSGTAEANATVTVFRNSTQIGTTTANGSGAWSFDYTGTTLASGTHTFTATAKDAANNTSPSSPAFLVEIDSATPNAPVITAISNDSGASSTDGVTSDNTLSFTGTAEANTTITISRSGVGVIGAATADGSGAWSFDYTGTTLAEGAYLFTAFATDTAGNASNVSADFPVTVDTTAPLITTQPVGGTYVVGDNFTLTVAATDATALSYQWSLGGSTLNNSANRSGVTAATLAHTNISLTGFNGNYTVLLTDLAGNTRTSNTAMVVVNKITATVTLGALSQTYNGSPKTAAATTTPAGLTVSFTYDGSSSAPINAGSYAVVGTIDDPVYQGTASGTLVIAKANQTITFPTPSPVTVGTPVSLTATASSGLGVSYSVISGNATVSGSSFTANDANPIQLRATQAGNANVNAATQDIVITNITKLSQTLTFAALTDKLTSDTAVALSATASSGLTVSFSVQSGPATVSGSTLTLTGLPGTITVVANQAGNAVYSAAANVSRSFTVNTHYAAPAPDGYAASVTGGAGTGSTAVTVLDAATFRTQAESTGTAVITVVGTLNLGATPVAVRSNKTIQGADTNATLVGNLSLGAGVSNVIVRGLNLTNPGTTVVNGAYTDGGDALTLTGATNVFITHCSFFDTADHALRITNGADNITVSWCEFDYTGAQTAHRYSVLIGNATGETTPLRVTLHHNRWGAGVDQRAPLSTFGHVHLYNNSFNFTGNTEATVASDQSQLLSERNVYNGVANPLTRRNVNATLPIGRILAVGNGYNATTGTAPYAGADTVFTPGYSYELLPISDVATEVNTHAGNISGANVTDPATATATITGPGAAVDQNTRFTLTAVPSGLTPTSYQWRRNNIDIVGATGATFTVASAQPGDAATYAVALSLSTGDVVVSRPLTVTLAPVPGPAEILTTSNREAGGGAASPWYLGILALLAAARWMQKRAGGR